MSDRDAAAETKEPYALARRGLPLRGLAPTAPRAHWLPPLARTQPLSTASHAPEPIRAEASLPDDDVFDPFAIDAPISMPTPQAAASPLIHDAGTALSIIADEGFERAASPPLPSRALSSSAEIASPLSANPQETDASQTEGSRPARNVANEPSIRNPIPETFAPADGEIPTTAARSMAMPAATDAFDASTTETRHVAVSEPTAIPAARGAIASRERDAASGAPAAPLSRAAMTSPQVAVSDPRSVDDAPASAIASVAASARTPASETMSRTRDVEPVATAPMPPRRQTAEVRDGAERRAAATLRHETIEMGEPAAVPLVSRETNDAQARALAPPRPLDAAQIASLLAPPPASNANAGPSVTIDRVQVTVQSPATVRPAAPAAAAAQPAAASSRAVSSPAYRNPWASYFARRD
jgi:hypothetical protein